MEEFLHHQYSLWIYAAARRGIPQRTGVSEERMSKYILYISSQAGVEREKEVKVKPAKMKLGTAVKVKGLVI